MNAARTLLACSPACDVRLGSESLVGYRVAEALSTRHVVTLVTSAGMAPPTDVETLVLPAHIRQPNDASPGELLKYERHQRKAVDKLLLKRSYDALHRITPSGYKDSLLAAGAVPLILGPVLGADPHPAPFDHIFRPRLPQSYGPRGLATRIRNGIARRVFSRHSTLQQQLEQATLILVGTQVTLRRLPARLQGRCRYLPFAGVEHAEFLPPRGPRHNRTIQLLYAGRLVPYKGVELLLRAAAQALTMCRFELRIVGSGPESYRAYCESLAARLRLTDAVTFVENQPRETLPQLYQQADVFCMPSIETYGIAILEAMSCGCAVLVSDLNGPGEIVQPGTGLKTPLETPQQFIEEYAGRIVQLVEDAQLRRDLGEAARAHVMAVHDWSRIQASLLEIYDEFFPGPHIHRPESSRLTSVC